MKQILITGANSGLGLASSVTLAEMGHHIIMLCRNQEKGERALQIVRNVGSAELVLCDLSDLEDVRRFAKAFGMRKLDVLMHNAGVIMTSRQLTKQGFEMTVAVNHLAVFLLTDLLLPNLSRGSRIVVVSSGAHHAAKFDLSNWMAEKKFSTIQQYGFSKMCNILFTKELAKRLKEDGITVNAVHPGGVNTHFGDNNKVWYSFIGKMIKWFLLSPEKGADTQVWLAVDPQLEGQTGGYYYKRKAKKVSKLAASEQYAAQLWKKSLVCEVTHPHFVK